MGDEHANLRMHIETTCMGGANVLDDFSHPFCRHCQYGGLGLVARSNELSHKFGLRESILDWDEALRNCG